MFVVVPEILYLQLWLCHVDFCIFPVESIWVLVSQQGVYLNMIKDTGKIPGVYMNMIKDTGKIPGVYLNMIKDTEVYLNMIKDTGKIPWVYLNMIKDTGKTPGMYLNMIKDTGKIPSSFCTNLQLHVAVHGITQHTLTWRQPSWMTFRAGEPLDMFSIPDLHTLAHYTNVPKVLLELISLLPI